MLEILVSLAAHLANFSQKRHCLVVFLGFCVQSQCPSQRRLWKLETGATA